MLYQSEKYPRLALEKECTGCLACVDCCPKNAIKQYIGKDGHVYVTLDKDECVGCKKCERICNASRMNYGNNKLNKSQIYAAWTGNQEDRKNATSGGIFASLARYIINNGGVVVGACLQDKESKHILIKDTKDIKKLQGSKYMFSSMSGIYKVIEQEISQHKVLFSGVGCQCAGVLAYFEYSPYKSNLITMDLVCGGAPSQILLTKFYQENPNIEKIISFRSKDKYELKVLENGSIKEIKGKSLPLHGFNCELTNKFNCYHCQFACAHRKTDITIGDLWNYEYMPDEHSRGISSVIVHSQEGSELLKKADILMNEIKWKECISYCKRIVWGKAPIFYPRKKLKDNAEKLNSEKFRKLYCMDIKPTDFIMFSFRVYRYIIMHIYNCAAKFYIKWLEFKFKKRCRKLL